VASLARRLALDALLQVDRGGVILGNVLASPSIAGLAPRDRGLLHELVLGTLRRRGWLDHALRPLVTRPLERLDRRTRAVLRLGAYQILATRVPDRAAVSESVDLLRRSRTSGLANAVLRRLTREGPPSDPDETADPLGWLTTAGSLPAWLAERWLERLGAPTAVARAKALLTPPTTTFRTNPRALEVWQRLTDAGVVYRSSAVPEAFQVESGSTTELAARATIAIQDLGSQLVGHLAAVPGLVLDACSAPGGKAALMADLLGGGGRVVAVESSRPRLATLAARIRGWGCPNVLCIRADAARPPVRPVFDGVLLDAPCSGLGTLARQPDIRWRVTPGDLERHSRRQADFLRSLADLVKPGGRLVYSTCSLEPEENEGVIEPFLASHADFGPAPLPAWASPFVDGRFVRTLPERDHADGFFVAVLQRAS